MNANKALQANGRGRATSPRQAYDDFKKFEGRLYTGMKVGRSHKWRYDPGEWKETKVTPDKWEFKYAVTKRRAGKAPEGSGVPVGTAYHWYILAHQIVTKLDANSYSTEMAGVKHKLAHKRAEKNSWSASEQAQRKRLVQVLREMIAELEHPSTVESIPEDAGTETRARRPERANGRRAIAKRRRPASRRPGAAKSRRATL